MSEQRDRVEISWVQVSASALAAVSSAVLLSTVGVAGTIVGAAIGSVIATAGSSIYSHYLRITRERVTAAQAAALERVGRARASVTGAAVDVRHGPARTQTLQRAQQEVAQAGDELDQAERELRVAGTGAERPTWREILSGLPWKRIALGAAVVFAAAMLVIVTFEMVAGRPVSSYTGGSSTHTSRTSIPGLGSSHPKSTPTPQPTITQHPSSAPTTAAPSAAPSQQTTPSPSSATTPTPSATPSATPSGTPTATTTPVPTPTAAQTPVG